MVLPMGLIQSSMVRTHRQVAEIDNKVRTAKLLLRDVADRITEAAEIDRALTVVERAQCRLDIATSVHLSYEAVEQAFLATGGSAISVKNPLQRFMRDMHAVKSHYFMDLETARELSGKVMLGQKPFTYLF
jgi:alkylation response protein AidB-like acyl-CoA dehydrogenase